MSDALRWVGEHPVLAALAAGVVGAAGMAYARGSAENTALQVELRKTKAKLKRVAAGVRSRRSVVQQGKLLQDV